MGGSRVLVRLVVLAFAVGTSSCQFQCSVGGVSTEKVEKATAARIAEQGGLDVTVKCPALSDDSKETCVARTPEGVEFNVQVTVEDGEASFQTRGVGFGSKLAPRVSEYLRGHGITATETTCPPVVIAGRPDDCKTVVDDVTLLTTVTMNDADGASFDPKAGFILLPAAERLLAPKVPEPGARIRCGEGEGRLAVARPGATFPCVVERPGAPPERVTFRIKNERGDVETIP